MMRTGPTVLTLGLATLIGAMLAAGAAEPSRIRSPATQRVATKATTLTPAQETYIQRGLTPAQRNQLASLARTLARSPSYSAIQGPWTQFVRAAAATGRPMDINAMVAWILRQSALQTQAELKEYAEKVEHYNELKNQLRQDLERLRSQRARAGSTAVQAQRTPVGPAAPAAKSATAPTVAKKVPPPVAPTEEDRLTYQLAATEAHLQSAQRNLIAAQQMENRLYNMLSNVMKAMHDEAASIIRNTR